MIRHDVTMDLVSHTAYGQAQARREYDTCVIQDESTSDGYLLVHSYPHVRAIAVMMAMTMKAAMTL
jgi:hypothetical protein